MAPIIQDDTQTLRDEELYELTEDGRLPGTNLQSKRAGKYDEGSVIDWLREDASERQRIHTLRLQPGARGILLPLAEASRLWFVVILTGIGIGVTGAWLDILVKWCAPEFFLFRNLSYCCLAWVRLSDLREGHCSDGFFYNQVACCSGLDRVYIQFHLLESRADQHTIAGDVCYEWWTWSQSFGVRSIFGQSILQCTVYVVLAVRSTLYIFGPLCMCCVPDCICRWCCCISRDLCAVVSHFIACYRLPEVYQMFSAFHTGSEQPTSKPICKSC